MVVSGGFDSATEHIKEFFKNNSTKLKAKDIINEVFEDTNNWFLSPHIDFEDKRELDNYVRVNKNAYTGHYSSKLFNLNKGLLMPITRSVVSKLYDIVTSVPTKNYYLWSILGREKDIKVSKNDIVKPSSTRAIMCCEDAPTTLLMWFAQKIQLCISLYQGEKKYNIDGEYDIVKANRLKSKEKDYDLVLDSDWTFFDSNIDTEFIIAAAQILLSNIKDDKIHRRIKYYITSSLVTKYIALPPGVVVELNRGIPSGHPFTTLMNCNINLLY